MIIRDKTTKEERLDRSKLKDHKFIRMIKDLAYKTEGEVFVISSQNSNTAKIMKMDHFEVELSPV